eukprot:12970891-Ditylum_brightwellii.AAC.1
MADLQFETSLTRLHTYIYITSPHSSLQHMRKHNQHHAGRRNRQDENPAKFNMTHQSYLGTDTAGTSTCNSTKSRIH